MKFAGDELFYWSAGCTSAYFLWAILAWTFNGTVVYLPLTNRVSFTSLLSITGLIISYRIVTSDLRSFWLLIMTFLSLIVGLSCLDDIIVYFELIQYCKGAPSKTDRNTCDLMEDFYHTTAFMVSVFCAAIGALHVFTASCYYRAYAEQRSKASQAEELTVTVGKPV